MLQKISDFIKSELQFMLKNRQQSQKKFRGLRPLDPHQGAAPGPCWGLASPDPSLAPSVATSRKTFSGAMINDYDNNTILL